MFLHVRTCTTGFGIHMLIEVSTIVFISIPTVFGSQLVDLSVTHTFYEVEHTSGM